MPRRRASRNTTRGPVLDVAVSEIGARGDGIADSKVGRLYIPYAAPGDVLRVQVGAPRGDGHAARIDAILELASIRQRPICRHFGACGGCALQHIRDDAVADMKAGLLRRALARQGLEILPLRPTITVPPGTRRRIQLTYRRGRDVTLGFNRRASRKVLDVAECPLLRAGIANLLGPLRELCREIETLGPSGDLQVTETEAGIDLMLIPARQAEPGLAARETAAAFADRHDLCRISWQSAGVWEPIAQRRPALVRFGGIPVAIPPTAFLQPSKDGENAIVDIVTHALEAAAPKRIADLYAGCGALGLPATRYAPVLAVEGDTEMSAALDRAASGRNLTVATRDLQRDPMAPEELSEFDAVIFDPPRAGARPVAEALAASTVPCAIAVSCNPATLARDLRILLDSGYRLTQITPIDQFTWSAHVEAVAVLCR